jgi:hypothetical protein
MRDGAAHAEGRRPKPFKCPDLRFRRMMSCPESEKKFAVAASVAMGQQKPTQAISELLLPPRRKAYQRKVLHPPLDETPVAGQLGQANQR